MKDLPDEVWKTDDLCSRMLLSCQIKGRNETTSIEKKPKTETGIKDITEDTKEESLVDVQEDEFMFGGIGGGGDALISGRRLKGITDNKRAVESDEDHVIRISNGEGMIQSSGLNNK